MTTMHQALFSFLPFSPSPTANTYSALGTGDTMANRWKVPSLMALRFWWQRQTINKFFKWKHKEYQAAISAVGARKTKGRQRHPPWREIWMKWEASQEHIWKPNIPGRRWCRYKASGISKKPQRREWLSTVPRKWGRRGLTPGTRPHPTSTLEKSLWLLCEEQAMWWDKGESRGPVRQWEVTLAQTHGLVRDIVRSSYIKIHFVGRAEKIYWRMRWAMERKEGVKDDSQVKQWSDRRWGTSGEELSGV